MLLMDLDGLKYINDTFGHNEGDKAISAFADILKTTLRKDDIIGRIGGDEFVVFSSIKPNEKGDRLIERLKKGLELYNSENPLPYTLSASIGSTVLTEATKECFEAAILGADSLLYEEKTKRREQGIQRD